MNHVEMQVQTGHPTPPPAGVPPHPYRQVAVSDAPARCETDGTVWHVRNTEALADHPQRMTDCLVAGAQRHPDRVLDVRTPGEFSEGHLQGARNIDFTSPEFRDRVRSLNRNRTYLVYCRSGNRSGKALEVFRELGFASVLHMDGGTLAWNAAGLPLEK